MYSLIELLKILRKTPKHFFSPINTCLKEYFIINLQISKLNLVKMKLLSLLFSLFYFLQSYSYYSANINFNYFMLAETWPKSFCKQKQCIPNVPLEFSVHGLWPKNNTPPHTDTCTTDKNLVCISPRFHFLLLLLFCINLNNMKIIFIYFIRLTKIRLSFKKCGRL